jgi:phosphate:Na+ symporter
MFQSIRHTVLPVILTIFLMGNLASTAFSQKAIEVYGPVVDENSVRITWHVDCNSPDAPKAVVVRYNRAAILANEGDVWLYTAPISYSEGNAVLSDLNAPSNYVYQVGSMSDGVDSVDPEQIWWSARQRFTTKIPWGLMRFLLMIGALSLFIYGMKTMSEGIQASAGVGLRKILAPMTKNRFTGVLSGFIITALLQSSSATSVMIVSFVNAGLVTLTQSVGLMMGANIGTTITGWLVSYLGYRIDITVYALILFALATPLLLVRKPELRALSTALVGFAMLFMGLGFLKSTVPEFDESSPFVAFFIDYSNIPVVGVLLFVLLGTVVTIIVQSSSTAITLTMALCASGVIPLEVAAAMVLGENIGTTATAEISALVGNVHAKRSARIHTLFNILGAAWMVFLIPTVLEIIAGFLSTNPYDESDAGHQSATIALAAFHTIFNVANLLLLIWFVPFLVKLATKTVPSRGADDEMFRLEYIDSSIQISEISIVEAKREVAKFGEIVTKMSGFARQLLTEIDSGAQLALHNKIKKYEEITDRLEIEISQYCSRISTTELSPDSSERVRSMLSVSNDMERVGDIFYQISNTLERKRLSKIWFTQEQRANLFELFDAVDRALQVMVANLKKGEREPIALEKAYEAEKEINRLRNKLRKDYLKRIEEGNYNLKSGTVYSDLFSSLEKVGDHVINVSEALAGKI